MAFTQFFDRLMADSQGLAEPLGLPVADFKAVTSGIRQHVHWLIVDLRYGYEGRDDQPGRFYASACAFFVDLANQWGALMHQRELRQNPLGQATAIVERKVSVEETARKIRQSSDARQRLINFFSERPDQEAEQRQHRADNHGLYLIVERWLTPNRLAALVAETLAGENDPADMQD